MAIRLRQLEAFRAVSHSGNITRAAESLGISQPAVSRLLSHFSTEVGFELFQRRDGRLIPTQESRYLLGEVERLLDSLSHIEDLTKDLLERKAGHLRIACLPGFATSHLPGVVARFLKTRPGVTVTIEPDRPERILEWIIGEQYDFGITEGFAGHPAIESQSLNMRTVCILPTGHALSTADEIWPEDLASERMIHTRRDSRFFHDLEEQFLARGVPLPSLVEVRQFTAACMLVAEGVGVSVVSELDARQYARRGLILKPFRPKVTHRLTLLNPIHTPVSMITLEFIEAFRASLEPYLA
ncbi:MAG: LysR family transcriptional regulator, partial [Marinosulfonomonas sp.]|nr:LysR family transcriptional regulator [Marinosulfonomonas sp.]